MSRWKRIRRWSIAIVVTLLVVGWVLYTFVLPGVAEKEIRAAIRGVGLEQADLSVRHVGASGIQVTDVYLDADKKDRIESLRADYNVGDLLENRIKHLTVTGAHLGVGIENGALDLGAFGKLKIAPSADVKRGEIPFQTLNIRSSELTITIGDRAHRVGVEGTITNDGGRQLTVDLRVTLGVPLDIAGSIDLTGSRPMVDLTITSAARRTNGEPSFIARVANETTKGGEQWQVAVKGAVERFNQLIAGTHVLAHNASIDADIAFGLDGSIHELELTAGADVAAINGRGLHHMRLRAIDDDAHAAINASFAGPGWFLKEAACRLPLAPNTWRSGKVAIPLRMAWLAQISDDVRDALAAKSGDRSDSDEADVALLLVQTGENLALSLTFSSIGLDAALESPEATDVRLIETSQKTTSALLAGEDSPLARAIENARPLTTVLPAFHVNLSHIADDASAASLPVAFDNTAREERPKRWQADLHAALSTPQPTRMAGADLEIGPTRIEIIGQGRFDEGFPRYDARAKAAVDYITLNAARTRLELCRADLPLAFLLPTEGKADSEESIADRTARIEVEGVALAGREKRKVPGIIAKALRTEDRIAIDAEWPINDNTTLTATGNVANLFDRPTGHIAFDTDSIELENSDHLRDILEHFIAFEPTGELALEGRIDFRSGRTTSSGRLNVTDVTLERKVEDSEQKISGINATLNFERLFPPRSAPGQTIKWDAMTFGDFAFASGQSRLTLESADSLLVEQLTSKFPDDGGRVSARAFRLGSNQSSIDLELVCENLRLDEWVSMISFDHVTGHGRLFGRVPLAITWDPELSFKAGAGFLQNTGEGSLQLIDEETARRYIGEDDTGFLNLPNINATAKRALFSALQDLAYSQLRFDFIPDEPGSTMRIRVSGKGRTKPFQEIGLVTFNVSHFDHVLTESIKFKADLAPPPRR